MFVLYNISCISVTNPCNLPETNDCHDLAFCILSEDHEEGFTCLCRANTRDAFPASPGRACAAGIRRGLDGSIQFGIKQVGINQTCMMQVGIKQPRIMHIRLNTSWYKDKFA